MSERPVVEMQLAVPACTRRHRPWILCCVLIRYYVGLGFLGMAKMVLHCCYACENSFAMVDLGARKSAASYQKDCCGNYAILAR
jgi:hypothetical protein